MDDKKFSVGVEIDEKRATLTASGHFSEMDLRQFEANFVDALEKNKIIVDLTGLEYICSWGFGIMVEKSQTAQERGGNIVFIKPETKLYRLFEMLQLDQILKFASSKEEANAILDDDVKLQ